jgi:hypothetical protein
LTSATEGTQDIKRPYYQQMHEGNDNTLRDWGAVGREGEKSGDSTSLGDFMIHFQVTGWGVQLYMGLAEIGFVGWFEAMHGGRKTLSVE